MRVANTPVGKGVFAQRSYPAGAVIGDITGDLIRDHPEGSSYSFEIDDTTQLEPHPPFRFLNHSCEPNCEFDWYDEAVSADNPTLFVIALRKIESGEELTIDYNWPAAAAIPCQCGELACRGWIVSEDELHLLPDMHDEPNDVPEFEDEPSPNTRREGHPEK